MTTTYRDQGREGVVDTQRKEKVFAETRQKVEKGREGVYWILEEKE